MSKVSILLPAYNREHYLEKAIESVLGQTYQNWELLISDNCSSDNTPIIAQKYAKQDNRIKFCRNEQNIGSVLNYNKCIAQASGDYIELFGADDIIEPTCLEKFVSILNNSPNVVLVTSGRRHIDENGNLIREDRPRNESQLIPSEEAIASNMRTLTNWIISPVMYRSQYKGDGFELALGIYADLVYWAQILHYGDLYYLDEILFNYRVHPVSETTARLNNLEFIPTLLRTAERYKKYLSDPNVPDKDLYKIVMDKLVNIVDYSTNFLHLNFDSYLGELCEKKSNKDVIENIDDEAKQASNLLNDLRDFKRISYLALMHALELRKERDWLVAEYSDGDAFGTHTKMLEKVQTENEILQQRIDELSRQLDSVLRSQSWKITAPLRMMKKGIPSG
jgi:glycosyltransferase involved in cell wall biosynthesis